ncbi:MAG: NAD-dependent epimerase/dehydratase family protein [Anaerolineales bacterium]|nr:NAD-dependent epimerase/dehydratase family protein [Anaerolineales bacterium]
MNSEVVLVTGAMGCIGSWVLYHLVRQGRQAVAFDLSDDRHRLDMLLTPDEQRDIAFVRGDLTNFEQVKSTIQYHRASHIVHLAALQVPFCKADPVMGAKVNVTGTVNIFQAALETEVRHLAYASSIAVYGPADEYPPGLIPHEAPPAPRTLYGVYKVANEGTARVYWQDHSLSSVGLRPAVVYGVGRDQGLTSDPTRAMLAAVRGEPFTIGWGGTAQYQLASDVALQFIDAALLPQDGAGAYNLGMPPYSMEAVVEMIRRQEPGAQITIEPNLLPFPEGYDGAALKRRFGRLYETPLDEGIRQTMEHFGRLMK